MPSWPEIVGGWRPFVRSLAATLLLGALAGCASVGRGPASASDPVSTSYLPSLPAPEPTHCAGQDGAMARAPARLERQLDPLDAPTLFTEHFFPNREDRDRPFIALADAQYATLADWADEATGLHAALMIDHPSGHAVLMFRGVTRIGSDPGGFGAFFHDAAILLSAKAARENPQILVGEAFFHRARCEPEVRSLEVIGYSLGSQVANALAVRQRAVGTVFGDMGLDPSVIERDSEPDKAALRADLKRRWRSLQLSGDLLVRVYAVGETVGERIDLPAGLVGVLHQPEVYVNSVRLARGQLPTTPSAPDR